MGIIAQGFIKRAADIEHTAKSDPFYATDLQDPAYLAEELDDAVRCAQYERIAASLGCNLGAWPFLPGFKQARLKAAAEKLTGVEEDHSVLDQVDYKRGAVAAIVARQIRRTCH